ncbi:hypothetical protein DERP_001778 [Dermatophagoides pteronyssinus]|uniref:Secreted protein n=1 Tax=Dermatophagoides pteronyssinus TaxID=6956 RepID=A0ABQ8JBG3_DERPT|nr:hypothetical protein DERP_001778 [Dermatophagoides pteronyssinus]
MNNPFIFLMDTILLMINILVTHYRFTRANPAQMNSINFDFQIDHIILMSNYSYIHGLGHCGRYCACTICVDNNNEYNNNFNKKMNINNGENLLNFKSK